MLSNIKRPTETIHLDACPTVIRKRARKNPKEAMEIVKEAMKNYQKLP
jgi:hypothetical protein